MIALVVLLAGCVSAPSAPVRDKLDADTGSTVTVLKDPLELVNAPEHRGGRGIEFAYLAPFETDQMGAHTLLLWVLVPNDVSTSSPPVIHCDDKPVELSVRAGGLGELDLAEPPYEAPYPWSTSWYFALTDPALACFAQAHVVTLEIPDAAGEPAQFRIETAAKATGFPSLQAFVAHRGN